MAKNLKVNVSNASIPNSNMNTPNNHNAINVGVYIGKAKLDIYLIPLGIYFVWSND